MYTSTVDPGSANTIPLSARRRPPRQSRERRRNRGRMQQNVDRLVSDCYPDLLRLAAALFQRESPGHLLEPGALVSELYLRLVAQRARWRNRAHFFAVAARLMRRILIDHARRAHAAKRSAVPDCLAATVGLPPDTEELTLEQALTRLARRAPRQHDVVRLRCHGGLTVAETARALSVSPATVKLDWRLARTWLAARIMQD